MDKWKIAGTLVIFALIGLDVYLQNELSRTKGAMGDLMVISCVRGSSFDLSSGNITKAGPISPYDRASHACAKDVRWMLWMTGWDTRFKSPLELVE